MGRYKRVSFTKNFLLWIKGTRGATAIEYALIATGISLFIATSVYFFGEQLSTLFYDTLPAIFAP